MKTPEDLTLNTEISKLPLVGATLTKAFHSIGVFCIADLLYNFPTRYMDYRKKIKIAEAVEGETVTVSGIVKSVKLNLGFRSRMASSEIVLEDSTGYIKVIWFNQTYIAKQLKVGDELILSGKVSFYKTLQFTNPAYEIISENQNQIHTGRLVPIYKRSDLIPLRTMRRLTTLCLPLASKLEDFVPQNLKNIASPDKILPIEKAITALHFPETEQQILEAKYRLAIDDLLPQQLAVELQKDARQNAKVYKVKVDIEKVKLFLETLPFELTPSQKRATWDIFQDFESGKPMNRLLQGDVGSGKTIVALLSALQIATNGHQTAVLAPTEILAKQHYDTFLSIFGIPKKPLENNKGGIALLTNNFTLVDGFKCTRQDILNGIKLGNIQICIGTHAVLQKDVNFKDLALIIIDEQHRFGVAQRSLLTHKKNQVAKTPHFLSMSATPIPRTLAMSIYGDLSVSTLSQLPSGRRPVQTMVVSEENREFAYDFIREEAKKHRQAFIVTPRVEETNINTESISEVRSVKKEFENLKKNVFKNLRLGLLYGKMKGADKDKVMAEFVEGKIDVLVSTSVIEVGIDIPNATAMIIESSERFGLAQLHQLRGRIGRNNYTSKCFLFTTEKSQLETDRLNLMATSNDGFALAEFDLKQRGFGDLFGKQQSGFSFRFPQFITTKALSTAQKLAANIKQSDPTLINTPKLKSLAEGYLKELHSE